MIKIKYAALLGMTLFLSACSQTAVTPTCNICNEGTTPIINQCPKKVATINYTDACGTCNNTYSVTIRKNSCCSAQGCDK